MPSLLRRIKKGRWLGPCPFALAQGDLQAKVLLDLRAEDNRLSVYRIEEDLSNLPRVAGALAAGCDNLDNFDYALFPDDMLKELRISLSKTAGGTPDGH